MWKNKQARWLGEMSGKKVTSLRRYRAQRFFDGYVSLPRSQRTGARSALLLEAIFEYAYEHVSPRQIASASQMRVDPEQSRLISQRLEEFIPRTRNAEREPIMRWLHDNLVPEAWAYPDDIRHLMQEFLRES